MNVAQSSLAPGIPSYHTPTALKFSILAKLPSEILIYIAEFLTPAEAASYALSCTPIYELGRGQYLKTGNFTALQAFEFLKLLSRDLPDCIACCYCRSFHNIRHANLHAMYLNQATAWWISNSEPQCWKVDRKILNMTTYLGDHFGSTLFDMVMKRHRQGADCSALLGLLAGQDKIRLNYQETLKMSTLCRIINGSLLVRRQVIVLVRFPRTDKRIPLDELHICSHLTSGRRIGPGLLEAALSRVAPAVGPQTRGMETPGVLRQCIKCATEYRVDNRSLAELGENREAVFFTKWIDFGKGSEDRKWTSHHVGHEWRQINRPPGSISAAFLGEGQFESDPSFNDPWIREKLFGMGL